MPVGGVRAIEQTVFTWIASGDLDVPLALRARSAVGADDPRHHRHRLAHPHLLDGLHARGDATREYARYFSYLNLFAAFMLVLVLGANFLVMFVGWEGVGLCSYLLIGFWYREEVGGRRRQEGVHRQPHRRLRRSSSACCCVFVAFGTLDFQEVARRPSAAAARGDVRHALARSRCCCSSARPASRRRFRSTSGCRTRWKARRRSPRSSTRRRW